jgi:hypothetical protein
LAFGQIVGGIDAGMIQENQKVVALFPEPGTQAFLGGIRARLCQESLGGQLQAFAALASLLSG